jgi:hypothetical protein
MTDLELFLISSSWLAADMVLLLALLWVRDRQEEPQ